MADPFASGMTSDPFGASSAGMASAFDTSPTTGSGTGGQSGTDTTFGDLMPDWGNPSGPQTPLGPDPSVTDPMHIQPVGPPDTSNLPDPTYNFDSAGGTTPGGTTPDTTSGSTSGSSGSWLDQLLSGVTGGQGWGAIGSMAPYLADFALASNAADKSRASTARTVAPLYNNANQWLTAATKDLNLYESGSITPAQQIMLDRNAATQKAALAAYYNQNGIQDSTMMQQGMQNIDNSTVVMKQGFVDASLQKALQEEAAGIQPLMTAVQDTLISDTALTQTMMQLMGTLAQAWAYQTAQRGGGPGGTAGGPSGTASGAAGGVGSTLVKDGINYVKNQAGQWINSATGAPAVGADGLPIDMGVGATPDVSAATSFGGFPASTFDTGGAAAASTAAADTSGLLPGSIAGADMTDTAAYTPALIEDTGASSTAAGGSALAGFAAGGVAFGAFNLLASYLMGTGQMSQADYLKRANGQIATLTQQIKSAGPNTDPKYIQQWKQALQAAQTVKALMQMTPAQEFAAQRAGGTHGRADQSVIGEKQL